MDRGTELALIDELLALKAAGSKFLDKAIGENAVAHYACEDHFQREKQAIFDRLPRIAAHSSEIAQPGDFIRQTIAGRSVLITRDKIGGVHALLNVCQHRGAQLVDEDKGCRHRFTCPYHAWTYSNSGELKGAPHFEDGFPGIEKAQIRLTRLPCEERAGLIWVSPDPDTPLDLETHIGPIAQDIEALGFADMMIMAEQTEVRSANWKILVEGGIEAYHFRIVHRNTIGPHFEDNLSSYKSFGPHMRSVLPRTSMASLREADKETWVLRDHANVLYNVFPSSQFLVMQDHIVWVSFEPLSAGETRIRLVTLAPKAQVNEQDHWTRNHKITMTTLDEDFVVGEGIQSGMASGAIDAVRFGRFEGALTAFNAAVSDALL